MAEQVALLTADAGDPVDPGQHPGLLQLPDRDGHGRAGTFGNRGDLLVAEEGINELYKRVNRPGTDSLGDDYGGMSASRRSTCCGYGMS